ncbi:MAG TPA: hypothetical protein VEL82_06610 [Thermoplasmata archaeon]|nr:hypothetical protein [Thermoplasmata archaeon]
MPETSDAPPRFSDARVTVRWVLRLIVPIVVITTLVAVEFPRPAVAVGAAVTVVGSLVAILAFGLWRVRLPRTR